MLRFLFVVCLAVSALSMGCCGPMGVGPGCNTSGCNDCDGLGGSNFVPSGPLENIRQLKKQLTCGSGCGEVYMGEWISTPPDCNDPCCNDQFVGGAVKARPFCLQRGTLVKGMVGNMFGGRYCSGSESSAPCDCGSCNSGGGCATGSCGGGGCQSGSCGGGVVSGGASSCGCASNNSSVPGRLQMAGRKAGDMMQARAMDARVNYIRQ